METYTLPNSGITCNIGPLDHDQIKRLKNIARQCPAGQHGYDLAPLIEHIEALEVNLGMIIALEI